MRLDGAVLVDAEELFNLALLLLAPRVGLLVVLELYDLTIRRLDLVAVAQSGHGVELAVLARNLLRCAYALSNRIAAGPELDGVEHEYVSHSTHCVCRRNEDKDKLIEELIAGCFLVPTSLLNRLNEPTHELVNNVAARSTADTLRWRIFIIQCFFNIIKSVIAILITNIFRKNR